MAAANGEYKAVCCHREASTGCSPGGDAALEARSKEGVGRFSRLGQQAHRRQRALEVREEINGARRGVGGCFAMDAPGGRMYVKGGLNEGLVRERGNWQ